jgi:hypothetical protein
MGFVGVVGCAAQARHCRRFLWRVGGKNRQTTSQRQGSQQTRQETACVPHWQSHTGPFRARQMRVSCVSTPAAGGSGVIWQARFS